jgi:MFS family permease
MDALIVGRVIAGIGGAGMYLGALNYIAVFTTMRERTNYMGLTGLVWGEPLILRSTG